MVRPSVSSTVRSTRTKWATRLAKATIATSTPSTTPTARLLVTTVATTVTTITVISDLGIRLSVRGLIECQSNVAEETSTITTTKATFDWQSISPDRKSTRLNSRHVAN